MNSTPDWPLVQVRICVGQPTPRLPAKIQPSRCGNVRGRFHLIDFGQFVFSRDAVNSAEARGDTFFDRIVL